MDLIWGKRKAIYFQPGDWTTQITLIPFDKFAVARKLKTVIPGRCEASNPESRDSPMCPPIRVRLATETAEPRLIVSEWMGGFPCR
jgi:hypothetical protein